MNVKIASLLVISAVAIPSLALSQSMTVSSPVISAQSTTPAVQAKESTFSQFRPNPSVTTRLDFQVWDEALKEMVLYTGPSLRQVASRPVPITGTRITYGHTSPLRLEGNKVIFEGIEGDFKTMIDLYVEDLVSIANRISISTLPRDEQLSFWLNLHNALAIQGIAEHYPLTNPSQIKDENGHFFHDIERVVIQDTPLSLKNIREDIVYANWSDPLVIYGFFHGDLGSPSLQRKAFTADSVWDTLRFSGKEFVGSLRGFRVYGNSPRVSRHYKEASPYFFADDFNQDVRQHMASYMPPDLQAELENTVAPLRIAHYAFDIADMTRGTNDRTDHGYVLTLDPVLNSRPLTSTLARSIDEISLKMLRVKRRGLFGTVTIEDIQTVSEPTEEPSNMTREDDN